MNVLFVPTLGLDLSLLERLAASVDYPIRSKVAFNNGEPGALDEFRDKHDDWIVKESAFGNLGVAGSWNQCAKMFPEEPSWLIMNDDAWFLPGYLQKIQQASFNHYNEPIVHLNSSNAYYTFVWTQRGKKEFGEFDENFWPAYCLSPETLVLTDDLRWQRVDMVVPGDSLIGVEEYPPPFKERKYLRSQVISRNEKIAPSIRIVFEDGREVTCTTDHKWLTKWPYPSGRSGILWKWRPSSWIHPGCRVYAPLRTWSSDWTYNTGWLAGILDGEGCYHTSPRMRGVSFSQREGSVLERAKIILNTMDIHYTVQPCRDGVTTIEISTKRDAMELIGRIRPVRFMSGQSRLWEGVYVRSKNVPSSLVVKSVELIGDTRTISIQTTSRTLIANGIISHNCEDCDTRVRHRLKGYNGYVYALEGLPPLPHGKPKTGGMNYKAMLDGCGLLNRQYWYYKWGNQNFEEATYQSPYKDHRLGIDQWAWYPEQRAIRKHIWDSWMSLPNPSIYE